VIDQLLPELTGLGNFRTAARSPLRLHHTIRIATSCNVVLPWVKHVLLWHDDTAAGAANMIVCIINQAWDWLSGSHARQPPSSIMAFEHGLAIESLGCARNRK
jgi:hypothetical protein